jgi:hypothetical protein
MELTKEHLDEVLKSLATKKDLGALATSQELAEITTDLAEMKTTLASHTTSLDKLLTAKKTKADERVVSANRFDRLEHWAQLVGQKLDIKLEL